MGQRTGWGRLAGPFLLMGLGLAASWQAVAQAPMPAQAQVQQQSLLPRVERTRLVTPTRLVTLIHGLEYDLVDALRASDRGALDRLLAAEFEQRNGVAPNQPVPRAEWLAGTAVKANGAVRIVDLAVHERGELLIASFRMALEGPRQLLFVVDVWRRSGESFELLTRYSSDLPLPVQPVSPKPDGKR